MSRRPAITILVLCDREVMRADFGAGREPRLLSLKRRQRAGEGSLATVTELAISLGSRLGRRVLVLSTAVWTQTISVPARTVDGMGSDELAQSLKFEIESFSGIGAFDSRIAYRQIASRGSDRAFWVSQLEAAQLTAVDEMVTSRGGKLVGLGHPAGLPSSLQSGGNWKRREFWRNAVVGLESGRELRLFLSHNEPRSDRWQVGLDNWEREQPTGEVTEWLVEAGVAVPGEHLGENVLRLDDEVTAQRWLMTWVHGFLADESVVPLLRPPPKPVSQRAKTTSSVLAAAAMLAVCGGHWTYVEFSTRYLARQIETLKQSEAEKQRLEQKLADAKTQQQELQGKLTAIRDEHAGITSIAAHRGRLGVLLEKLARDRTVDMVVTELSTDQQGITIAGTSLRPDSATRLAQACGRELLGHGWKIEPPEQTGQNQLLNGGPWTFRIVLRDVGPVRESSPQFEARATQP